ncbi:MAG: biotin/lipoyl-containing protein [Candidatus Aminicenantes bacterium]
MNFSFWLDGKEFKINLEERAKNDIQVILGKKKYKVAVEQVSEDEVLLNIDGKIHNIIINSNTSHSYSVYINGRFFKIERKSARQLLGIKSEKSKKSHIRTSMPGKIVRVLVKEGDKVKQGQAVLVLEAMKMQNEIKSPQSGTVSQLAPRAGDSVEAGTLLFSVE